MFTIIIICQCIKSKHVYFIDCIDVYYYSYILTLYYLKHTHQAIIINISLSKQYSTKLSNSAIGWAFVLPKLGIKEVNYL